MSDTHDTDAADLVSQSSSPGELLRRERETQGLSRGEVATALNLRPAVVVGLEEDTYDQVPIAAYRRGYLRAYARLLGIEERPILDAYTRRFGHEEPPQHTTPVQVTKPPSRLGAWLFKLVTLLVIAGLIGLTLVWWQSRGGGEPPDVSDSGSVSVDGLDGTSSVVEESRQPTSDEGLPPLPEEGVDPLGDESAASSMPDDATTAVDRVDPSASQTLSATAPAEPETANAALDDSAPVDSDESSTASETPTTTDETGGDETVADVDDDASNAENESAAPEATSADGAASEPQDGAANADANVLAFTFNQQSWTEVFDANDERIFVGLQEPGTSARVEGEPPFRLTVGNASGVELEWRGEVVNITDRAGANNVARFTLGE
ncbi:RodZ domain-containing protein [Billgrantia gudaonensis]|uniref:Cytoskeleton protein RodZ n=1 Tax=Billgrantia gudaonensis TaxID=376427 RepID=A0A1G9A7N4_9GAMM|nr:RodZ domain-containing protein [Halomonas gudaonensis]SDK23356.1 cytoskeleton protein RodZ [Halomonas gudaonensis]